MNRRREREKKKIEKAIWLIYLMTSSTATKAESMAPLVFREFDAVFVHFDRVPVRVQRSKASMGRRYSMFHSCKTEKKYFLNPRVLPYSLLDISSSSSFES